MKEKPTDRETAKYNAISSIADLLRETTYKNYEHHSTVGDSPFSVCAYRNGIFNESEHETVKRSFLRLISEI